MANYISYEGAVRLIRETFIFAVKEASYKNESDIRQQAREFLLIDGAIFAEKGGLNVTREMIEAWAESGWPRPTKEEMEVICKRS